MSATTFSGGVRRAAYELQLRLEVGHRDLRPGREEVGNPAPHADERGQRSHVETRQIVPDPSPRRI
jgi:hypothetical protein